MKLEDQTKTESRQVQKTMPTEATNTSNRNFGIRNYKQVQCVRKPTPDTTIDKLKNNKIKTEKKLYLCRSWLV